MKDLSFAGKLEKANQELFRMLDMNPLMYEESNPVGLKALLEKMGICKANVRLPLAPASDGLRSKIDKVLKKNKG